MGKAYKPGRGSESDSQTAGYAPGFHAAIGLRFDRIATEITHILCKHFDELGENIKNCAYCGDVFLEQRTGMAKYCCDSHRALHSKKTRDV